MLRAGMIRQSSAGIYSWLPLGLQSLAQGRADRARGDGCRGLPRDPDAHDPAGGALAGERPLSEDYGKEMLRITDRHDRPMLYGPTHEEVDHRHFSAAASRVTRTLPFNLYQIQWKFRDEIRPRFGVMRGREFYMKDNYSFDFDLRRGAPLLRQRCSSPISRRSGAWA